MAQIQIIFTSSSPAKAWSSWYWDQWGGVGDGGRGGHCEGRRGGPRHLETRRGEGGGCITLSNWPGLTLNSWHMSVKQKCSFRKKLGSLNPLNPGANFRTKTSFDPHVSVHGEMFRNFAFKFCQNLKSWGWFQTRGPWGEAGTKYPVQLHRIRESFSGQSNTILLKVKQL